MRRRVVPTDSNHLSSCFLELLIRIPESAGLLGASWRLVSRVEIDDDGLALELREAHGLAVLILQREGWRGLAFVHLGEDGALGGEGRRDGGRGGIGQLKAVELRLRRLGQERWGPGRLGSGRLRWEQRREGVLREGKRGHR